MKRINRNEPPPIVGDSAVCPYCKVEDRSPWEYDLSDGNETEVECECGATYMLSCSISVTYQSDPLEPAPSPQTVKEN